MRLLELGAIPIINENDTVVTDEIGVGDNDTLAAIVAVSVGADLLVLLSDINGLYTADPHRNRSARLIERVEEITPEIEALADGRGSNLGTGGMRAGYAPACAIRSRPMFSGMARGPPRRRASLPPARPRPHGRGRAVPPLCRAASFRNAAQEHLGSLWKTIGFGAPKSVFCTDSTGFPQEFPGRSFFFSF